MDSLLNIMNVYGPWIYALLFLYCALKSGSLPLFAGYAAQADLLSLTPVALATFAGGYLGDEARFAIARRYGIDWLQRWPRVHKALSAAQALVTRYGRSYVFLYRYPKGMRTIGALPMGLGSMTWIAFSTLNAASAALWTLVLVGTGYVFGAQVEQAVAEGWGVGSVILLGIVIAAICFVWWRMYRHLSKGHAQNG